jgi:hypothetical protein
MPSWGKEPVPTLEFQSNIDAHTASSDGNSSTSLYVEKTYIYLKFIKIYLHLFIHKYKKKCINHLHVYI